MKPVEDESRHWTEPGIYLVAPGVYRIPLPLPEGTLSAVNVYAVADGAELVLIDAGWALDRARDQLDACLRAIGASLSDVREFLVTHAHRDHYTQAVVLRRDFGSRISLGEHEAPALALHRDPAVRPLSAQCELLRLHGAAHIADDLLSRDERGPRGDVGHWDDPDEWLAAGPRKVLPNRLFDVVHTPGHTSGHVVFDDVAEGLLFAGDHVLPHITPAIGLQPNPVALPLRDYLASLSLVRARPDRRLLPAHGPVGPSVHARVDELLEHHRQRFDTVRAHVVAGASTASAVASRLAWTREGCSLEDIDPMHRMLAVLETAAHLDLLCARGELVASEVDAVRHYLCFGRGSCGVQSPGAGLCPSGVGEGGRAWSEFPMPTWPFGWQNQTRA